MLLSASSWDPISQTLQQWQIQTIADNYYNGQTETAQLLLENDLILPFSTAWTRFLRIYGGTRSTRSTRGWATAARSS